MARAPNEKLNKAYALYQEGYKLVDIAKELDIPDGTVRRWKKTYNWDSERSDKKEVKSERSKKKKVNKKSSKKELVAEEVKEVLQNTELTEKQRLFCIYYIEDFNATKAYKKAYRCSYDTAMVEGSKSLRKPKIKKEIDRLTKECLEEQKIESKLISKRVLQKYIDIAFSNMTDFVEFGQKEEIVKDDNGEPILDNEGNEITYKYNYVSFKESDEVDGSIIAEVSHGKNGSSVKLQDKMKAIEFLAKYSGLLDTITKEKLEIEKQKLEIAKIKSGAYEEEEEVEDDGFIAALGNKVAEVWSDEENSQ